MSLPAQYAGNCSHAGEKRVCRSIGAADCTEREFLTEQLRLAGLENGVELIVYAKSCEISCCFMGMGYCGSSIWKKGFC